MDLLLIDVFDAMIGNGHAVGISGQIPNHILYTGKRLLSKTTHCF